MKKEAPKYSHEQVHAELAALKSGQFDSLFKDEEQQDDYPIVAQPAIVNMQLPKTVPALDEVLHMLNMQNKQDSVKD